MDKEKNSDNLADNFAGNLADDFGGPVDAADVNRYIDHTLLKPDAQQSDILRLCDEAARFRFASVCINPVFVPAASERLRNTGVKVCTVIGFPLGATAGPIKAQEARWAVEQGAAEVDMVLWVGGLKERNMSGVGSDIAGVVKAAAEVNPQVIVKVIMETCLLTEAEKIEACRLAEASGAHFVKTSTGFSSGGATVADVKLMRRVVSSAVGVKASGGIRTAEQVLEFIRAGANRIGTSSGVSIMGEMVLPETRQYMP